MLYESPWGHIHYDVSGPREAPLVVLTHGIAMDHSTFDPQVAGLRDSYRVVVWDMPEHGRSFRSNEDFRLSVAAECLMGVLNETGAQQVVLVGQSLGSFVSQYAAYKYPERVVGLVHVGGAPLHQGMSRLEAFAWHMALGVASLIPEKVFYRWFASERAITEGTRQYLEASISKMGKSRVLSITKAYLRSYAEGIPEAPGMPSLITYGEQEVAFVRKKSSTWHASESGSELVVIPEAGHIANQDNPVAFNRVLMSFVQRTCRNHGAGHEG